MAILNKIKRGQTVTEQIDSINENIENINEELQILVNNEAGYVTEEDIKVKDVNGKTGNVILEAKDVNAFPNNSTIQNLDINNMKKTGVYIGTYASNPYYLIVIKYNDTNIYQELIGLNFKEYRRFTGAWGSWIKEYSTENPVKAGEIADIKTISQDKDLFLALLDETTFVKANIRYNPITQRLYIGDKQFATTDYVDNAINTIKSMIVTELPDVGVENTIYFVPAGETDGNLFAEYIYVNNSWEIVGGTQVDLTPFLTIQDAENTYAKISSLDDKVSKTTTINGKSLEDDINLTAEDVGALPNTTVVPNIVAGENISITTDGNNVTVNSTASGGVTEEVVDEKISTATSGLVSNTRTVNGKSLSSDITLTATDVGAMPIDGTVTNVTFSLSGTTLTITPITGE